MGNESSNYNHTYTAWLSYQKTFRSSTSPANTPPSKLIKPPTPNNPSWNVTPNTQPQPNQNQFKPVVSTITTNKDQNVAEKTPLSSQLKNIPATPKQNQQTSSKRSSIVEVNPHMLKTEMVEQKVMSTPIIPGTQPTILPNNVQGTQQRKLKFSSKIDVIDSMKTEVKATRTKIDTLANAQQRQYIWILSEIQNEKIHLIPDRSKLIYLLKQAKDYETLIVGLRTKRQQIVRVLNQLNEQRHNEEFKGIIAEANQYLESIQQQFVKIDWKTIILEASTNLQRYIDVINEGSTDPVVQYSLGMIEKQVDAMRPPPPPQVETPTQQPKPTQKLPQNEMKNSKILSNDQPSSKIKQDLSKSTQQVPPITEEQDYAALRSSLQLVSNIQRSSIRISDIQQSLEMNQFGLVVTSPSLLKSETVSGKVQKTTKSDLTRNNHMSLQQGDLKGNKQKVPASEIKGNIQELSEIKNVKMVSEAKSPDVKQIKPILNNVQSMIKPPPSYNPFSMPQNLLQ